MTDTIILDHALRTILKAVKAIESIVYTVFRNRGKCYYTRMILIAAIKLYDNIIIMVVFTTQDRGII